MLIPTPQELGFPEKFSAWRPPQIEALQWLLSCTKRVKALTAPTGFGKTAVYMAYALIRQQQQKNLATCFVTDSRALQDQLMDDFSNTGLVDLRGRNNYACSMREDYTCDIGYAARCPHKGTASCPSTQAEIRAACSTLVTTNYKKWTSARKYGQGMEHFDGVVFDEGHVAPNAVEDAMQVVLHHKEIEDTLELEFPPASQAMEFVNWKSWASVARAAAEEQMLEAQTAMRTYSDNGTTTRHYLHMRNLTRRLVTIMTASPKNWIVDDHEKGYVFDPIQAGKYAEAVLLLNTPDILIVSATLRPKTLYQLGIGGANFEHKEFDSDFDPARSPIYYVPTMRVDNRATDLSPLWVKHDQIAARRTDRKGIVHTVSYNNQRAAQSESRYSSSMLLNNRGEAAGSIVHQFKRSKPGTILVSPSVAAGFDFPGRDCEWQLLLKIPFPNGQTKIHKARQEQDKEHGAYLAMNKMVQTFGRGMRSRLDRCENFIVDAHLDWFLPRFRHLAPKWFHQFFKQVTVLPAPPEKL